MNNAEIRDQLPAGWTLSEDGAAIERTFTFDSFVTAMAFMASGAAHAQRADHHPEWRNVYNRVEVRLSTHSAGGVTSKDLALAEALDGASTAVS